MEASSAGVQVLSMRNVDKHFAGVQALHKASLEVLPGEVMALVGQNGAGKSTLIKVLTGAYRKDGGEVRFLGQPVEFGSPEEAQRAGISTIYQEINLVPYRSVAENICLGHTPTRYGFLQWRTMNRRAVELLRRFSVNIDVRRPLSSFSTALQQMVAIARAVSFEAKLVIMDEPTSSLDEREVELLFQVVRQLKAQHVAVIFVSHKLDELYSVCDRVTVMRDGRTVLTSPMSRISKLELVAAMLGRDLATVKREGATAFAGGKHETGAELLRVEHLEIGRRVRDARLAVHGGEIVGLAGLLGSGRTEIARTVFGADRPDAGTIAIRGEAVRLASPADAIARGVGFCTEDRKVEGIVPEMSVRENLTLALLPRLTRAGIVDERRQQEIVERFIARLGIKTSGPDQKIRELSGGNQQKVLLARWLCMNPQLLILDEPTRGIDVGAKAEIQALIKELADQGLGVLMISSELEEIVEGSDHVFVLREGRTVADLEKREISEERIIAAMAHGPGEAEASQEQGGV
jgi:ribose transport system ATP-binding protein